MLQNIIQLFTNESQVMKISKNKVLLQERMIIKHIYKFLTMSEDKKTIKTELQAFKHDRF